MHASMPDGWQEGVFGERVNRFLAHVEVNGQPVEAHVPNTARLPELLRPGAPALLEPASSKRRTRWTLRFVAHNGQWVSIDSHVPNRLVANAFMADGLPEVTRITGPNPTVHREVSMPWGRCDFVLEGPARRLFLEVKSSSLVRNDWALWPDAPTERGRRHIENLSRLAGGEAGMVLFVVQKPGARGLSPNRQADPAFGDALDRAVDRGLMVRVRQALVQPGHEELTGPLPYRSQPPDAP